MVVTRRLRFWVALPLALGATWSLLAVRHDDEVRVSSAAIDRGAIAQTIVATGDLEPAGTVQVGAQVSGTIDALYVDCNSVVRAGQALAKIDPSSLDADLSAARARLAEAEATRLEAQANETTLETQEEDAREKFDRAEHLSAAQLAMPADLDAARATLLAANAGVDGGRSQIHEADAAVAEARAAVEQAKIDVDRALITSPIDGVVVARNVSVGQTVASSFQAPVLFTIAADLRQLQLNLAIDESDIGGVQRDAPVTFTVEAYGNEHFSGRVSQVRVEPVARQVADATTPGSATAATTGQVPTVISYSAMVSVANLDARLRPGMTATAVLPGARRDSVLRIPNQALAFEPSASVLELLRQTLAIESTTDRTRNDPTLRRLWRYDGSQFLPVDVQIGLADSQFTELVSGPMREGDAVVIGAAVTPRR